MCHNGCDCGTPASPSQTSFIAIARIPFHTQSTGLREPGAPTRARGRQLPSLCVVSLNHLVRAQQHILRDCDAERFEVDDKFELRRLLDGEIGRDYPDCARLLARVLRNSPGRGKRNSPRCGVKPAACWKHGDAWSSRRSPRQSPGGLRLTCCNWAVCCPPILCARTAPD